MLTGQSKEEVQAVSSMEQLDHFVSIGLVLKEDTSLVQVHVLPRDTVRAKKTLLLEQVISQVDFSEEDQHEIRITCQADRLDIFCK